MEKEEIIEKLISDDIDTIKQSVIEDYAYNIFRGGHKGYENFTDEELEQEYKSREFEEVLE